VIRKDNHKEGNRRAQVPTQIQVMERSRLDAPETVSVAARRAIRVTTSGEDNAEAANEGRS
jgi:hypothetical protein